MKYRKKPVEIEAMIFTEESATQIVDWSNHAVRHLVDVNESLLNIETLEGTMTATIGDYIIKGVKGEFYPCKPDIFELTYDKVI